MRTLFAAICLCLLVATTSADPKVVVVQPYQPPAPEDVYVTHSVFAAGRLWALTDTGTLSSIAPDNRARRAELVDRQVLGICGARDALLALACQDRNCRHWRLLVESASAWQSRAELESKGDKFAALQCDAQNVLVITERRTLDANEPARILRLSQKLAPGAAATSMTTKYLYVGFDAGEWGGGMVRVDRATGQVRRMEKNESGGTCGGPLNSNCDPVKAMIPVPGKPDCVLAAVGLVHLGDGDGRIVEVCEDHIVEFYSNTRKQKNWTGESYEVSDPFFGVAQAGDAILAVGLQGLYRFDGTDKPRITSLPQMQEFNGVWASFDDPDVVLVQAGGNTLLVPRTN